MKRILVTAAFLIASVLMIGAQSISLTEQFGANDDDTSNGDFITFERKEITRTEGTDPNTKEVGTGKYESGYTNDNVHVDNRLQLDFSSEKFDAKLRLQTYGISLNGKGATTQFKGFFTYKPVEYVNLIMGNDYLSAVAAGTGKMYAKDGTPDWALLAKNGISLVALPVEGLKLLANVSGDSIFTDPKTVEFNAALEYRINKIATLSVIAKDVFTDDRSFTVLAGLDCVENLNAGLGFIYNMNMSGKYLTIINAASPRYGLVGSFGYTVEAAGLSLYLDFATGLSRQYMKEGKVSEYDGIPLKVGFRASCDVTKNFELSIKAAYAVKIGSSTQESESGGDPGLDPWKLSLHPYVTMTLPAAGSLSLGVRMKVTSAGLLKFSIPVEWKCKIFDY